MENHNAINGKIHYKWAMFNSYVKLPEGNMCDNFITSHVLCFVQDTPPFWLTTFSIRGMVNQGVLG